MAILQTDRPAIYLVRVHIRCHDYADEGSLVRAIASDD